MRTPSTYLVDLCLAHTVFRRTPRRTGSTRAPLMRSLAKSGELCRSLAPPQRSIQHDLSTYPLFKKNIYVFLSPRINLSGFTRKSCNAFWVFWGRGGGIGFFPVIEVGQATKNKTPAKPQLAFPRNNSGEMNSRISPGNVFAEFIQ